jgi:uncharacterized membrane protein
LARKRTSKNPLLGYAFVGVVAILAVAFDFIRENLALFICIAVIIIGVAIFFVIRKKKQPQNQPQNQNTDNGNQDILRKLPVEGEISTEIINKLPTEALHHFSNALNLEIAKDFLGARMHYMQCMELMRGLKGTQEYEAVDKQYEKFASRDPIFNKLAAGLLKGIKQNPGILQSEITSKFNALGSWGEIQFPDREISKDDIYYALYFMDRLGYIARTKKGRSYELYPKEDAVFKVAE